MKKISFSALFVTAVIIITIMLSSCSRKVGCYFSVSPQIESGRLAGYTSSGLNTSECITENVAVTETEATSCD